MSPGDKATLRLAIGLGLAVLVAYGLALAVPFVVCVMSVVVLSRPGPPVPLVKGLVVALLLAVLVAVGIAMVPLLEYYAFAGVLLTAVVLHRLFYNGLVGGNPLSSVLVLAFAPMAVAGVAEQALVGELSVALATGVGIGVLVLQVPAPREGVANWPLIGDRVYAFWTRAHTDLPALVQSMQPKIGNLAKASLAFVAGIGGGLLLFLGSIVVAGIMMAFGESGARAVRSIFEKILDGPRGSQFADLSMPRPSARSPRACLGVAFLQAIIVGICLLVAGVPWRGRALRHRARARHRPGAGR